MVNRGRWGRQGIGHPGNRVNDPSIPSKSSVRSNEVSFANWTGKRGRFTMQRGCSFAGRRSGVNGWAMTGRLRQPRSWLPFQGLLGQATYTSRTPLSDSGGAQLGYRYAACTLRMHAALHPLCSVIGPDYRDVETE
ncbi:hypothetical protein KM043_009481 [Ampulex compressa]|nr:hypothetical protein KM043_009481 [Ampulex compressa]